MNQKETNGNCKGGLTAHQGLLDFKQWSLPRKIPEGIK